MMGSRGRRISLPVRGSDEECARISPERQPGARFPFLAQMIPCGRSDALTTGEPCGGSHHVRQFFSQDVKGKLGNHHNTTKLTKLRKSIVPGSVLILLAGHFKVPHQLACPSPQPQRSQIPESETLWTPVRDPSPARLSCRVSALSS